MQTSKKKINQNLEKQIQQLFYQLMADLRDPQDIQQFFKDFLTKAELKIITKRLAIGYYLSKSRSYENIKNNLSVSSATIAAVAEQLKTRGLKIALGKIQAEEWAEKWASKIGKIMKFRRQ